MSDHRFHEAVNGSPAEEAFEGGCEDLCRPSFLEGSRHRVPWVV